MIPNIKYTFIVIVTLLFCSLCFASENRLRVFNTDYFTIKLPAHIRQLSSMEVPSPKNKDSIMYAFDESNKEKNKSILLGITVGKVNIMGSNTMKKIALKELSNGLRDYTANHCKDPHP